eukprot:1183474-Prorocentrum_minimum.AAC.2
MTTSGEVKEIYNTTPAVTCRLDRFVAPGAPAAVLEDQQCERELLGEEDEGYGEDFPPPPGGQYDSANFEKMGGLPGSPMNGMLSHAGPARMA